MADKPDTTFGRYVTVLAEHAWADTGVALKTLVFAGLGLTLTAGGWLAATRETVPQSQGAFIITLVVFILELSLTFAFAGYGAWKADKERLATSDATVDLLKGYQPDQRALGRTVAATFADKAKTVDGVVAWGRIAAMFTGSSQVSASDLATKAIGNPQALAKRNDDEGPFNRYLHLLEREKVLKRMGSLWTLDNSEKADTLTRLAQETPEARQAALYPSGSGHAQAVKQA